MTKTHYYARERGKFKQITKKEYKELKKKGKSVARGHLLIG